MKHFLLFGKLDQSNLFSNAVDGSVVVGSVVVREEVCFKQVVLGREEGGFTFTKGRDDDGLVLVTLE